VGRASCRTRRYQDLQKGGFDLYENRAQHKKEERYERKFPSIRKKEIPYLSA